MKEAKRNQSGQTKFYLDNELGSRAEIAYQIIDGAMQYCNEVSGALTTLYSIKLFLPSLSKHMKKIHFEMSSLFRFFISEIDQLGFKKWGSITCMDQWNRCSLLVRDSW